MLSTELSTFFAIFSLFALALAALLARATVLQLRSCRLVSDNSYQIAVEALKTVQQGNAESLSLKRVADLEATLTELTDSYESLRKSNAKLRARITMRENRAQPGNGDDSEIPDSRTDPDGYKRAMRLKLRETGALK